MVVFIPILAHIFMMSPSESEVSKNSYLDQILNIISVLLVSISVVPIIFFKMYLNLLNNYLTTIFLIPLLIVVYLILYFISTFHKSYIQYKANLAIKVHE